jgi:hypothetical protein
MRAGLLRLARLAHVARGFGDFLRGFAGLPGTPGAPPSAAMRNPAAARRALEERAAQRRNCC